MTDRTQMQNTQAATGNSECGRGTELVQSEWNFVPTFATRIDARQNNRTTTVVRNCFKQSESVASKEKRTDEISFDTKETNAN